MDSPFQPITKSTLSDEVAQRVVKLIRSDSYQASDRLPAINKMATRFGVGHPTLREALKKLEALGIVTIKHGSGVYINKREEMLLMTNPIFDGTVSKKMMVDLIEARIPIERKAVVLATQNATEEKLDHMKDLLQQAGENLDNDAFLNRTNMAFHTEVAVASGNLVLAQMLKVLANLFKQEQHAILHVYGSREDDHAEHLAILDAIRERNASLAEERMRKHLKGVRQVILEADYEPNN